MVQLVFTIWQFIFVLILTNSQNIEEMKSLDILVSLRNSMESNNNNQQSHMIFLHDSLTKISLVSRKICKGLR